MGATDETLALLRSIDASLKTLVAQSRVAAPKGTANDRDLDGKYGDPEVRFEPRDWTGDRCKGRRFSECPAPFLDLLAETLDYFAEQSEAKNELTAKGKPAAPFKRADAARARGWAKRVREGRVPVAAGARTTDDEFAGRDDDGF